MSGVARPLPGSGVVVREGDLMLVCAEGGDAVDELLATVANVARTGGDGAVLARRVAALLAADTSARFPACALSGPAGDSQVAVLVYGRAMVEVGTGIGSVTFSGVGAITSVDQLVPGPVERIQLYLPDAGEPDGRSRLDSGIVAGAGLVFLTSSTMDQIPPRPVVPTQIASAASWTRPTPPRGIASPVFIVPVTAPPPPVSPAVVPFSPDGPPVTAPPVALPMTVPPPPGDVAPPLADLAPPNLAPPLADLAPPPGDVTPRAG